LFRSRFFWQLYGGYAVVVAVFAIIVGFAVSDWLAEESLQSVKDSLRSQATLLEQVSLDALNGAPSPGLQQTMQRLGRETNTRLTVIASDGRVLADSHEDPSRMDNHANREEVAKAAAEGVGFSTRFSNTVKREMKYCALSVSQTNGDTGFVRASLSLSVIDERLSRVRGLVLLGAAIAALVALMLGVAFARRVTSRLGSMTEVAQMIAAGDYSRRVLLHSHEDEIGKLATAFNSMAEQMQGQIDRITQDRNTVEAILGSMVEGVVAVDRHEVVLHMNAVAGDILDVDAAAVIGRRIWEAVRVNEVARALSACLSGEQVHGAQSRIMRGEEESVLDIRASPLTDGDGQLTGALVVFHDVTEMHRLELVRSEFVVNASHELKTPITAIRGFLDSLVEDRDMPVETRERFLRRASLQADRLSLLVTDLLRLSRFEAGVEVGPPARLDLRDVIRKSVAELQSVAAKKNIQLTAELGDDSLTVVGDEAALGLIVDNLIDNAIKYTPEGGHVDVRAEARDGSVLLEVADDGIGIDQANQDRIFERFYRVDKARSREAGGTGLGLAIAKHACSALKGELAVESELGAGSTFRVRLPLAD